MPLLLPSPFHGEREVEKLYPKVSGNLCIEGNLRPLVVANGSCKPNTFGLFRL